MATTATAPERKVSAAEAREVAEAAREQEWAAPSFVRDLFLGKFRLDLIHPYPEQDPEEVRRARSEEHTSELQSRLHLVCRLLLEKKKTHMPNTVDYLKGIR